MRVLLWSMFFWSLGLIIGQNSLFADSLKESNWKIIGSMGVTISNGKSPEANIESRGAGGGAFFGISAMNFNTSDVIIEPSIRYFTAKSRDFDTIKRDKCDVLASFIQPAIKIKANFFPHNEDFRLYPYVGGGFAFMTQITTNNERLKPDPDGTIFRFLCGIDIILINKINVGLEYGSYSYTFSMDRPYEFSYTWIGSIGFVF